MKIAILGESPADELLAQRIVEHVLKVTVTVEPFRQRTHGWTQVVSRIPNVVRQLHFNSDAIGLIVVIDADQTEVHSSTHPQSGNTNCRVCQGNSLWSSTIQHVGPRFNGQPLQFAIACPVPALEGWLLWGKDKTVGEAGWINGQKQSQFPYNKLNLKTRVYNTERPSIDDEKHAVETEFARILRDSQFDSMCQAFPQGLGRFVDEIRSWKQ